MAKRRPKNKRSKLERYLSAKEHAISYLSNCKFKDEGDEEFRQSLLRTYVRGLLTDAQWHYIFELKKRHKRAKKVSPKDTYYVYAIEAGDDVKIGYSCDPEKRAKAMQTGNSNAVRIIGKMPCENKQTAINLEKKIHKDAKRFRIRGEWFKKDVLDLFGVG